MTLIIYILATLINVIFNTVKIVWTAADGNKWKSASINAITYGFYTYVIILIAHSEISIYLQMLIVGGINFIGVFATKLILEKLKPTKIWKFEIISKEGLLLKTVYCKTHQESSDTLKYCVSKGYDYFITENRV